ncbi:MAG TPA: hypothetical protein VE596_08880 [Gaiellaceae bacterium]|nr:hypothetical protein [Gaiellaceae bacterium]
MARSPTSLARELERSAAARWSWTTYRHLGRRPPARRAQRRAA